MHTTLASVALALALVSALVSAPPARADDPAVSATAAEPAGVAADPAIDRGFLLPTAMTQPKGTLTYNNYEVVLHGLTYGVTDRVQVSATVFTPVGNLLWGLAGLKAQVVATPRFRLALQGTAGGATHETGNTESVGAGAAYRRESRGFLGSGLFASLCLDRECASLLSAGASHTSALGGPGAEHVFLYDSSLVVRVSDGVKVLGEVTTGQGGTSTDLTEPGGLLVSYGVRFHGKRVAGDVGFVKPYARQGSDGIFPLGLPFVSLSARTY
jgi:hypothetical protein